MATGDTGLLTDGLVWGQLEPLGRFRVAFGQGVFVTSATTATVYCPFDTLFACIISPVFVTASQAANGELTLMATPNATTGLIAVSSNSVTIGRIAGTDSALSFSVLFVGR